MKYLSPNYYHYKTHNPAKGWDPVSSEYAASYAETEFQHYDGGAFIDGVEKLTGPFKGKRILDLGAGPGAHSIEFMKRGAAQTVWHDVSSVYQKIAQQKAQDARVSIEFSIGYLEDAVKFVKAPFDLVFNNICWNYCIDDKAFAKIFFRIIKPGGKGYIRTDKRIGYKTWRWRFNQYIGIKIGHCASPVGRIPSLFRKLGAKEIHYEITDQVEIFVFQKPF
jgi:SAM-dependent methyltransferase